MIKLGETPKCLKKLAFYFKLIEKLWTKINDERVPDLSGFLNI